MPSKGFVFFFSVFFAKAFPGYLYEERIILGEGCTECVSGISSGNFGRGRFVGLNIYVRVVKDKVFLYESMPFCPALTQFCTWLGITPWICSVSTLSRSWSQTAQSMPALDISSSWAHVSGIESGQDGFVIRFIGCGIGMTGSESIEGLSSAWHEAFTLVCGFDIIRPIHPVDR